MMKTKILLGIISFYGIFLLPGCSINDSEDLQNEEQENLSQYIKSHNITVAPTADGLYYIETKTGTGISPVDTDYVLINTTWYLINGNVVQTNDTALASRNGITPFISYKGPVKLYLGYTLPGLQEGICKMKEGGKARLIVPSKLAYDGYGFTNNIPAYSTLIIDVELVRVIKDPVADDLVFIKRYLDTLQLNQNNLSDGIYMKIDTVGTGDMPATYDTVIFQYKVKALDTIFSLGTQKFLSSKYTMGVDSIIPGLKIAFSKLNKGSEARIIVPYNMAWGSSGYSKYFDVIDVPPYTSVYYQVIINDIRKYSYK